MQVFHVVARDSVDAVLRQGLQYGSRGVFSQDDHAKQANAYLDTVCPTGLQRRGVSRTKCLYMYYATEGKIMDIKHGKVYDTAQWQPEDDDHVLLAVALDPAQAYLSDLDAYDAVAQALQQDQPPAVCRRLADMYWQRVLPLDEVGQYYQLDGSRLVRRAGAPGSLPASFQRVEVMAVADVPARAISQHKQ